MAQPEPHGGEPSMEEVLASIRRILTDSEADAAPAGSRPPDAAAGPAPPAARAAYPAAPAAPDGVFLLDQTMLIEEPAAMPDPVPDAPFQTAAPTPVPTPGEASGQASPPAPHPSAAEADYSHLDAGGEKPAAEPLLAANTAAAASASLGALVRVVGQRSTTVYRGGPTLEDMVRDEIRPLVKAWLDENLAPMVERLVRTEIERVTRGQ